MTKKKTKANVTEGDLTVATTTVPDQSEVLAAILEEMKGMRAELDEKAGENDRLKTEVEAARATAADPKTRVLPPPDAWIEVRGDGPERDVNRKLDALQRSAEWDNEEFDRERTKRVLLGLPVDDPEFLCDTCGTAPQPQTQKAYDLHQNKHELEAGRVIGKRR